MSDWEIHAPDYASMVAAAQALNIWRSDDPNIPGDQGGFITGGVAADGTGWSLNYYGTKNDATGNPLPGVYAVLRWNGDPATMPAVPAGAPVTVIPLPADSPVVFA